MASTGSTVLMVSMGKFIFSFEKFGSFPFHWLLINHFCYSDSVEGRKGASGQCCNEDGDSETCPIDDLGLSDDDFSPQSNSPHPQGNVEDESVKTEMKPNAFPKPASFWLSNNDLFSINHSSIDFKNKNNVNKNKKEQQDEEQPAEVPSSVLDELKKVDTESLAEKSEKKEESNSL